MGYDGEIMVQMKRQMKQVSLLRLLALGLLLSAAAGCVYRMTVQQGNFLDPAVVEQVQAGMTRSQVRFLLGTPMLPVAFDNDRWDYLYYLQTGRKRKVEQRRLTVFFENDKVARFENIGIVAKPATAAAAPAASPST